MSGGPGSVPVIGVGILLLVLWLALIPCSRRARLPISLLGFACAWALVLLLAWTHAPNWGMVAGAGSIAISIVLVITFAQLSVGGEGGDGGNGEDADGGLGRPSPDRPTGGGGPAEPSWWPEFERELRRYMSEQETPRTPAGSPTGRP